MAWIDDPRLTGVAATQFPGRRPVVKRHTLRNWFLVTDSPWGELELVPGRGRFLVAARHPAPPIMDPSKVPPRVARELRANLTPWCTVEGASFEEVVERLAAHGLAEQSDASDPILLPAPGPIQLIGEERIRTAQWVAGMLTAHRPGAPPPLLCGVDGIGKRSIAAEAARLAGRSLTWELPLRRVLYDSVFQGGVEKAVELIQQCRQPLGADEVLLITDAHLLELLPLEKPVRDHILLRELVQSNGSVILTSSSAGKQLAGLLPLRCRGLVTREDAHTFVALTSESVTTSFEGSAFDMLLRPATTRGGDIVPGRLRYLIDLAKSLAQARLADTEPAAEPDEGNDRMVLSPDDVAMVVGMMESVWPQRREGSHR